MWLQSGFVRSGLATTSPEPAPEAQAPVEPILHSRSVNAIGDSVAMNESTERFNNSASRSWMTLLGSGRPSTFCRARLVTKRRSVNELMVR